MPRELSEAEIEGRWTRVCDGDRTDRSIPRGPFPGFLTFELPLPVDSGMRVALSRAAVRLVARSSPIFWFGGWHIFPSSGHFPLLLRLLASLALGAPQRETLALEFESREEEDLLSFVVLATLFSWDGILFDTSGERWFHISHDEFCTVAMKDETSLESARAALEEYF